MNAAPPGRAARWRRRSSPSACSRSGSRVLRRQPSDRGRTGARTTFPRDDSPPLHAMASMELAARGHAGDVDRRRCACGRAVAAARAVGRAQHRAETLRLVSGYSGTEGVKRAVRAGLGVSLVLAACVADEVATGSLVVRPIAGASLRKRLSSVVPDELLPTDAANRFVDSCEAIPAPRARATPSAARRRATAAGRLACRFGLSFDGVLELRTAPA